MLYVKLIAGKLLQLLRALSKRWKGKEVLGLLPWPVGKMPLMVWDVQPVAGTAYPVPHCAGFLPPMATGGPSVRTVLESPGSSEMNEEESPEPDADYMEEYDSEEERKLKKRKRPPPKVRSSIGNNISATRSAKATDNDKPFPCSCKFEHYDVVDCVITQFNTQRAIDVIKPHHHWRLIVRSIIVVNLRKLPQSLWPLLFPLLLVHYLIGRRRSEFLWYCLRPLTWMEKRMLSPVLTATSVLEIVCATERVLRLKKWCPVPTVADQVSCWLYL